MACYRESSRIRIFSHAGDQTSSNIGVRIQAIDKSNSEFRVRQNPPGTENPVIFAVTLRWKSIKYCYWTWAYVIASDHYVSWDTWWTDEICGTDTKQADFLYKPENGARRIHVVHKIYSAYLYSRTYICLTEVSNKRNVFWKTLAQGQSITYITKYCDQRYGKETTGDRGVFKRCWPGPGHCRW